MYKTRFKIVCLNLQFCAAMKPGDIILKYLILTHSNNLVSLEITIYFRITNKDQNWVADILFCLSHLWSDSSDGSKGDRMTWTKKEYHWNYFRSRASGKQLLSDSEENKISNGYFSFSTSDEGKQWLEHQIFCQSTNREYFMKKPNLHFNILKIPIFWRFCQY